MPGRFPGTRASYQIAAMIMTLVLLIAVPAVPRFVADHQPRQADGLSAAVTGDEQAAPTRELRVMEWNTCSEYGDCPQLDDQVGRVAQLAAIASDHRADVIFMLEACESTVAETLAELGDEWRVAFAPWVQKYPGWSSTRGRWCYEGPADDVNDGLQGTAILVKGELAETTTYDLPSPWQEKDWESVRNLICTRHVATGVRLCATHYTPNWQQDPERPILVQQIDRTLEAIKRNERTVFAGDLNVAPPSGNHDQDFADANPFLDPVYDRFVECDQRDAKQEWGKPRTGERTTQDQDDPSRGAKIDYMFASALPGVRWSSCEVLDAGAHTAYSDHLPILGVVQI